MTSVELTEFLIKNLLADEDGVSVKAFDDGEYNNIEVLVNPEYMGAVIGKGGSIANAIRTIVQASSYANKEKKVRINISSI